MRHDDAGHDAVAFLQSTSFSLSRRVPDISIPYSSTHQHSVPFSSFEHCTGSNSPSLLHRGIRTERPLSPRAFERRYSELRRCSHAERTSGNKKKTKLKFIYDTYLTIPGSCLP